MRNGFVSNGYAWIKSLYILFPFSRPRLYHAPASPEKGKARSPFSGFIPSPPTCDIKENTLCFPIFSNGRTPWTFPTVVGTDLPKPNIPTNSSRNAGTTQPSSLEPENK